MLIFWKERLVFLATPKTGTTAIEAALESLANVAVQRPPALKHTTFRRYQRYLAPYLRSAAKEDFTVVAMMREPISWLGSWYRFRQRETIARPERSTAGVSFDAFVDAYIGQSRPDYASMGSQSEFLSAGAEGAGAEGTGAEGTARGAAADGGPKVFRYEDIDAFVRYLEDRLDCEIILPRLNVSPEAEMALSAATEARLRDARAADFALYDSLA